MNKFKPEVIQAVKAHRFAILYGLRSPTAKIWIDAAMQMQPRKSLQSLKT